MTEYPEGQSRIDRVTNSLDESLREQLLATFSLTNEEMGGQAFSRVLDLFCERACRAGQAVDNAARDFVAGLGWSDVSGHAVTVARFELARREAIDTGPQPLSAADLHDMPVERLLGMRVRRHPAARVVELDVGLPSTLLAHYPGLANSAAILLAGRKCGTLVLPLCAEEQAMFAKLARPRDLFDVLVGNKANGASPSAFHRLVTLGVVVAV